MLGGASARNIAKREGRWKGVGVSAAGALRAVCPMVISKWNAHVLLRGRDGPVSLAGDQLLITRLASQ